MLSLLFFLLLFIIVHCRHYDETAWDMASQYISETMVPEQDPCENFYNYACGKWDSLYGKDSENEYMHATQILHDLIKEAIEKIDTKDSSLPKFKKSLAVFYNQCTAESATLSEILYQLFTGIGKLIGVPPILSKSKEEMDKIRVQNVWYLLGQVQKELDVGVLFDIDISQSGKQCGDQKQTEIGLRLERVQQDRNAVDNTTVSKFVKLFGEKQRMTVDEFTLEMKVQAMMEFDASLRSYENETEFRNNMIRGNRTHTHVHRNLSSEENEVEVEHLISEKVFTLSELMKQHPYIEWDQYFKGVLSKDQLSLLQENHIKIYLIDTMYFDNLHHVIKSHSPETVLNYVYWIGMTKQYYSNRITLEKAEGIIDKKDLCFKTTLDTFAPAVARTMFDDNEWNVTEWRISINLMKESVFGAFRFLVQSADWLNREEKLTMIYKAKNVSFYNGIPSWLNNDAVLNYKTFEFDSDLSLPENLLQMKKKSFQQKMDRVFQNENPNNPKFENLLFHYNAMYSHYQNSIELYLGAVVPPLYHINYPVSLNYGMLGQTIGHELFHAFNLEDEPEYPWPSLKRDFSKESLTNIKDCLIQQYSDFCYDEENACINGKETLYENMADIDGLKVAYMAYKFTTQTSGGEPHIPKLIKLTDDQIFFLAYARGACGDKKVDLEEVHPPANSRIEVPIRNFQEAAVKFGCKMGKPLALVDRCDIYGNYRPMDPCVKKHIVPPEN